MKMEELIILSIMLGERIYKQKEMMQINLTITSQPKIIKNQVTNINTIADFEV